MSQPLAPAGRLFAVAAFIEGFTWAGLLIGMWLKYGPVANELGVKLVVDPVSLDLIAGSTVDFVESLGGAAFKVENPQAAAGCGCGASFGI